MTATTLDPDLLAVLGTENLLRGAAAAEYAVNGILPAAVAVPGTRREAAAVVDLAREKGWSLVPCGGGTMLSAGFPPRQLDLVLSTRRLNRVVDYQPDDMTVTVEPGHTLEDLQQLLATRNQFLPLDPPLGGRATVGGIVAAAASGPWRAAHGTPRDWVIGLRVVGADGQEVRGGGLVVKNVAGYDLPKLYTGSWGTLGLLTEITFKVMPRPAARRYCRVNLATVEAAERVLARVMSSHLQPSVLELVNQQCFAALGSPAPEPWSLYFQFLHVAEAVDWQVSLLRELVQETGAALDVPALGEGDRLLAGLRDLPAAFDFVAQLGTVSSRTAELALQASAWGRHCTAAPHILAHAATGQVYFCVGEKGSEALVRDLRATARAAGATCVFPRHEGLHGLDPWGEIGPELGLMRRIKQSLDPTGIFSPGRFAGGI